MYTACTFCLPQDASKKPTTSIYGWAVCFRHRDDARKAGKARRGGE
jgi:hypothetical protein